MESAEQGPAACRLRNRGTTSLRLPQVSQQVLTVRDGCGVLLGWQSYRNPPRNAGKVLQAVLAVLGRSAHEAGDWAAVRRLITRGLVVQLAASDPSQAATAATAAVRVVVHEPHGPPEHHELLALHALLLHVLWSPATKFRRGFSKVSIRAT